MVRRARRLALSRGLGHADVRHAARGRPAYRGNDDATAREIGPRSGARPDLRRDPRLELRKSRQPRRRVPPADHQKIRGHPARPPGTERRAARRCAGCAVEPSAHRGGAAADAVRDARPGARRSRHRPGSELGRGRRRDRHHRRRQGGYVLADLSGHHTPIEWARIAVAAYKSHGADRIVAEVNNGGEMVEATLRVVDDNVAYTAVHATRGKVVRAEPVAALYEQGRIRHMGAFTALEDQMCEFTPDLDRSKPKRDPMDPSSLGMGGARSSPDRADALVWAFTSSSSKRLAPGASTKSR